MKIIHVLLSCSWGMIRERRTSIHSNETIIFFDNLDEGCGKAPTLEKGEVSNGCAKKALHGDVCAITNCLGGESFMTCSCTERQADTSIFLKKDAGCEWEIDMATYQELCIDATTTTEETTTTTTVPPTTSATTTSTTTSTTTTTTTTTEPPKRCDALDNDNGAWDCTDGYNVGSVCKLHCDDNYVHKPKHGRKRKCKCKTYKAGNPKNRPWKRKECQWSAKRLRFNHGLFPTCEFEAPPAFLKLASVNPEKKLDLNFNVRKSDHKELKQVGNLIVAV